MRRLAAAVLCLSFLWGNAGFFPAFASEETFGSFSGEAIASEKGSPEEEILSEEDFSQIEDFLQKNRGASGDCSFRELLSAVMDGDSQRLGGAFRTLLSESLAAQLADSAGLAGRILALGAAGSVFAVVAGIFPGGQIAGAGTFLTGLLMSAALAGAFQDGVSVAGSLLKKQGEFMNAVLPAYAMAVVWSGCQTSAAAWMEFLLFLLRLTDELYFKLLLPLTRIYVLLVIAGGLVREDFLSRAAELLKSVIVWGMRSLVGVVLGFQLVQGMVLPFADSVKTAGMQKLLSVIPGVGAGAQAAAKVVLGAGVIVKNAVGAAAVLILAVLSLAPLLRLAVLAGLYQAAAAVLQPVADRRMIRVLAGVAEGQKLLLGIAAYGMVVFALAVALVCLGTNAAYLA